MFFEISIGVFIGISTDMSIDILIGISSGIFIDMFIDKDEGGGGGKEGRKQEGMRSGLLVKSNNPNLKGGENTLCFRGNTYEKKNNALLMVNLVRKCKQSG